ncbi:major facilitator superfamily domain-containing protein 9-like isoform X2 [Limulus polyphemus]|uniref:Major facilitator superfamily domain-containing protein 9-like isoform X2 n=1 Tax=Limulus polyphemus TaxID=6850 RepID=A0ABM1T806_LIMPO|nr:major facilitator superfamily domain-containing protein 9-like isoform X2 [Limulus polyphemus]
MKSTLEKYTNLHVCVYVIGFLDLTAVSMIFPLLLTYARNMGATHFLGGIIGSVYGGLQLFSSPLVGSWSDVRGRKFVLQICFLVSGTSYALLGVAPDLGFVILARVMAGLFKHTQTLCRAYLADVSLPDTESGVFGRFNAMSSLGFIVGPTIGGHLAETPHGFFWVCTIGASVFLLCGGLVWLLMPDVKPIKTNKAQENAGVAQIIHFIKQIKWSSHWDHFLVRFFLSFATLIYRSNFALLLDYMFNFSAKTVGYIISFQGIVSAVSGFLVGTLAHWYKDHTKLLLFVAVTQTLSLVGLTYAPTTLILMCCLVPLCISNAVGRVSITKITVDRCHKDEIGAVVGLGQSITSLARMLSPLVAGVAQSISIHGPGVSGAGSAAVGAVILSLMSKKPTIAILKED